MGFTGHAPSVATSLCHPGPQGGRDMNPADAFRKVQRQKEILRNKRERQFQRDASKLKSEAFPLDIRAL